MPSAEFEPHQEGGDQHSSSRRSRSSAAAVEEMTEEEEQAIYKVGGSSSGNNSRSSSPPARRGILQRITSIRSSSNNNNGASESSGHERGSHHSTATARLQSSYKLLEEEYCKLKFEQTELVALADQRKLQKQRSLELMESLEEEIRQRRENNANQRHNHGELEELLEQTSPRLTKEESKESAHELNSLWMQRDLESLKLDEAREKLGKIRTEQREMLDELHVSPPISSAQARDELIRLDVEQIVKNLEKDLQELRQEVQKIRSSGPVIGKEIDIEDSTSDTVSATSTLISK